MKAMNCDLGIQRATRRSRMQNQTAFTLIELLVVIAIVALLASMLLPALGKANAKAHSAACRNHLKQLQVAWQLYSDEHDDRMPLNQMELDGWTPPLSTSWVTGNARYDTTTTNLKRGTLFRYVPTSQMFHCPADRSKIETRPHLLRTRSYLLSLGLNGNDPENHPAVLAIIRTKSAHLTRPSPSQTWAFLDGSEATTMGGAFWIWPLGQPDQNRDHWLCQPSDRHDGGAHLSFVDGHVAFHRWRLPKKAIAPGNTPVANIEDLKDLRWLQTRLPEP